MEDEAEESLLAGNTKVGHSTLHNHDCRLGQSDHTILDFINVQHMIIPKLLLLEQKLCWLVIF